MIVVEQPCLSSKSIYIERFFVDINVLIESFTNLHFNFRYY